MGDRIEKKLQTVVLARYQYRHEAEFAAGFLDDAGIPYRLQIDDPAMGMTISTPATLWVRGMDVRAALEALDLQELPSHRAAAEAAAAEWAAIPAAVAEEDETAPGGAGMVRDDPAGSTAASGRTVARAGSGPASLDPLERALGLGLFVAAAGTAWAASVGTVVGAALVVVAAPFALAGLIGRAPGPVRRLLRAISGSAR